MKDDYFFERVHAQKRRRVHDYFVRSCYLRNKLWNRQRHLISYLTFYIISSLIKKYEMKVLPNTIIWINFFFEMMFLNKLWSELKMSYKVFHGWVDARKMPKQVTKCEYIEFQGLTLLSTVFVWKNLNRLVNEWTNVSRYFLNENKIMGKGFCTSLYFDSFIFHPPLWFQPLFFYIC